MNKINKESIIGISALLVHAAKIDEHYSDSEKNLIKKQNHYLIQVIAEILIMLRFLKQLT